MSDTIFTHDTSNYIMNGCKFLLSSPLQIPTNKMSIGIRKLMLSDINNSYCSWLNDPETNRYLESRFINWDVEKLVKFYNSIDDKDLFLAIIDIEKDLHIGNIKISSLDAIHNRAELGLMIGDKRYWGKGIATEAIRLVTDYCFSTLCLNKVTAGAYAENKASINAFLKNGFLIEGERREHYLTETGWTSAILLGKINKNS
jgi:[ribosomal protein S5]-alanine N-acetyltransferase